MSNDMAYAVCEIALPSPDTAISGSGSICMVGDQERNVHIDFRVAERDGDANKAVDLLRAALRSAFGLPRDTYVTSDFPDLLTRLHFSR